MQNNVVVVKQTTLLISDLYKNTAGKRGGELKPAKWKETEVIREKKYGPASERVL